MKNAVTILLIWVSITITAFAQNGSKLGEVTLPQNAEKRLALVIGNKGYHNLRPLTNTHRDVDSMTVVLQRLGFKVIPYKDLTYQQTMAALNLFKSQIETADIAVFYYSGHGIGYDSKTYMLPVDASISCIENIEEAGIPLNRVLAPMELALSNKLQNGFVFLDNCRSLSKSIRYCKSSDKDVALPVGLILPKTNPRGRMVVFATQEGTTADDDTYDKYNSLFTSELIKHICTPNLGIRDVMDRVADGMERRSGGKQIPDKLENLRGNFVFINTNGPTPAIHVTPPVRRPDPVVVSPPPVSTKSITVIAYKPNSNALDLDLAKLVVQELKEKFPDYDIRPQTNSKGLSNDAVVCTVTGKMTISKNPVTVNNETYNLVKADTELKLTFKKGHELLDEVTISEGATDHQEKNAIQNSINEALSQLKTKTISIPLTDSIKR